MAKKCNSGHRLYPYQGSNYKCDGCKMRGKGLTYRCDCCDYDLHKECMYSSPTITTKILPNHTFQFLKLPPPGRFGKQKSCSRKKGCRSECRNCDACGMPVEGFVYHCEETNWDLHPRCALLEKEIKIDGVKFKLSRDVRSPCSECNNFNLNGAKDKVPGWCYVSEGGDRFSFHVFCLMQRGLEACSNNNYSNDTGKESDGGCSGGADGKEMEKLEQGIQEKPRRGGRSGFYMKILKSILSAVLSVLIGDPITFIATVGEQLFA